VTDGARGPARDLHRRLLAWAAADEFVPLYAVYALLFEDAGLTAASISIAFMAWSGSVVVLEVPSGALADRVSRRRLLVAATVVRAAGFTTWLVWPGLGGVVTGFVLWGVAGAAGSGTWQALVWDELARLGRTADYTPLVARMSQAQGVAIAAAMLSAAPAVALVGIRGVAVLSIALHAVTVVLVLRLPEVRAVRGVEEPTGWHGWAATLRAGVAAATRTPVLARLVALGALLEVITVVEEYVPLLARDLGASDVVVPVLAVVPWVGNLAGAEVAARRPGLAPRVAAGMVALGAGAMVLGVASGHPSGVVGIGVMYATVHASVVLADARLQEHAPDTARATVTSVRGLTTELLAIGAFGVVGALSAG
jgi:MFS family permease